MYIINPWRPFLEDIALIWLDPQIVGGAFADSSAGWRFAFYINRKSSPIF